jgi:uncharacterized protein (DUF433 family)
VAPRERHTRDLNPLPCSARSASAGGWDLQGIAVLVDIKRLFQAGVPRLLAAAAVLGAQGASNVVAVQEDRGGGGAMLRCEVKRRTTTWAAAAGLQLLQPAVGVFTRILRSCRVKTEETMVETNTHIYDQAAYRPAEAAGILGLPAGTVNAWCFGHDYRQRNGTRKQFRRVIEPADPKSRELSFVNLCELHLLAVIRRHHGIKLVQVRSAIDFLRQRLNVPRPLATQKFLTNGVALFVEHAGDLLNVSDQGQKALREDFEQALARIEFGQHGGPVLLFPFTRNASPAEVQPRMVLVDPARSFGRPVLAGIYVRTEVVEQRFRAGDSIAEMAEDYGVPADAIEEALRFEHRSAA